MIIKKQMQKQKNTKINNIAKTIKIREIYILLTTHAKTAAVRAASVI